MGEAFAVNEHDATPTVAKVLGQTFPTGWGKSDTRALVLNDGRPNPHRDAGKPYSTISAPEIAGMVRNPPAPVQKDRAQWFIPSRYHDHDARSHEAQRERGAFAWLALDVDANNLPLVEVRQALKAVLGACSWLIYSTSSATAENRKWRALIPLKEDVAGEDYTDTAEAFFDLLEEASQGTLICDRALSRTGQAIYLPNPLSGFYEQDIAQSERVNLTPLHPVIVRRQKQRERRQAAEAEAKAKQAQRRAEAAQRGTESASPVDAFNAAHSVADLLARYGYVKAGTSNDWRSPLQSGGSYATRDYGDHWISLSASDAAADLGRATKNGARFGDAFDLFRHFEHGGDNKKAVAAYGEEMRSANWNFSIDVGSTHSGTKNDTSQNEATKTDAANDDGEYFRASDLAGKPVPPRDWHVPDLIPAGVVTTLNGDGGTGKSLVALQLAVATALGRRWLGMDVAQGTALFISAEDDKDEMHRRLDDVAKAEGISLAAIPNLICRSLAGKDALLAVPSPFKGDTMTETPLFQRLDSWLSKHRPALTVLDTLADLFGGNEVNRAQARQFIGMLRGLCLRHGTTVVLLAHPSLSGMSSGTGSSGSTAWNNSVRSRLYFKRIRSEQGDEPDPDCRELEVMKANYGRTGLVLPVRWQQGVFVCEARQESGLDRMAATAKAERVFLKLLRECNSIGRQVNHSGAKSYAPKVFASHPEAEGIRQDGFRRAMETLLHQGRVRIVEKGPPSRVVRHLVVEGQE